MSTKGNLRSVKPGDPPPSPISIEGAVESGTSRDVLASMRRALATAMDAGDVSSNALASTTKRIEELDAKIRRIDDEARAEEAKQGDRSSGRRSFNASAV